MAYTQDYSYYNISTNEGLPSYTTYSIAEDEDGRMWFGTKNGAVQYDGKNIRTYTSSEGLLDNEVLAIYHLGHNKILAVSFLDKFSFKNGLHFESYDKILEKNALLSKLFNSEQTPYRNPIVIPNSNQSYFINTNKHENRIYEVRNNTVHDARRQFGIDTNILLWSVQPIHPEEFICFGRPDKNNKCKAYYSSHGKSIELQYDSVTPDIMTCIGDKLFFTFKDTIWGYKIDIRNKQLIKEQMIVCDYVPHKLVSINHQIIALNKGGESDIYDSTLNKVKNKFIAKISNISDIYIDRNQNIWVSTLTNGVHLLKKTNIQRLSYHKDRTPHNIYSLCGISKDSILLGDSKGRLCILNKNKINVLYDFSRNEHNKYNVVWKIIYLKGKTLILTDNNFYVLDRHFQLKYNASIHNLSLIKSIHPLNENQVLLGAINELYQMDIKQNKVTKITMRNQRYSDICITKKGEYWFGNNNGLFYYEPKSKKQVSLSKYYPVCKYRIAKLYESPDSLLWVGTASQGLLVFKNHQLLAQINAKNGLKSGYIKSIQYDKGIIWVATNFGLSKINYKLTNASFEKSIKVLNYSSIGNLSPGEVNALHVSNEQFYLGTNKGLLIFNSKDLSNNEKINADIVGVRINNLDSPLRENYILSHNKNVISISYTGIAYEPGRELNFKCRLHGLEQEFSEVSQSVKEYGPLSPGTYTFEVYCVDAHGGKIGKSAKIGIEIKPAFYQTIWFYMCVISALTLLIFFSIKKYINHIKEKENSIHKTNLKIAELEMQAVRAQINPHFIFNCLNSIQHMVNQQDAVNANRYIAKFSHLIRQTLELSKNNTITLAEELTYIENYLLLEKMRFQDSFDYQIIYDKNQDYHNYFIPSMILQPYVENAIRHGVKYLKERQGLITIELIKNQDSIVCKIDDNGIGRAMSATQKQGKPIEYQSRGTELNQKRIDSYNMINMKKISVFIEDKLDLQGNSLGTCIHIKLPI